MMVGLNANYPNDDIFTDQMQWLNQTLPLQNMNIEGGSGGINDGFNHNREYQKENGKRSKNATQ